MTYLFTKDGCGKCDWVKSRINVGQMENVQVLNLDGNNPEALAMLAYFECVNLAEKKLPILVNDSGDVITGAVHIKNYLQGD